MLKSIAAVTALATLGLAAPALAAETILSGIEIAAPDNTVKLTVEVSGDIGPRTVVVSDRVGVNCGGFSYQWTKGENRQCWLWIRRGRTVTLAARGMKGRYGADWQVAWQGCEVIDDGSVCRLTPEDPVKVTAAFSGTPQ